MSLRQTWNIERELGWPGIYGKTLFLKTLILTFTTQNDFHHIPVFTISHLFLFPPPRLLGFWPRLAPARAQRHTRSLQCQVQRTCPTVGAVLLRDTQSWAETRAILCFRILLSHRRHTNQELAESSPPLEPVPGRKAVNSHPLYSCLRWTSQPVA